MSSQHMQPQDGGALLQSMKLRENHLLYSNKQLIMPNHINSFSNREQMVVVAEVDSPVLDANKPPLGMSKSNYASNKEPENNNNKT